MVTQRGIRVMEQRIIAGFENEKLCMFDIMAFIDGNKCALLNNKNGTIAAVERECLDSIESHDIDNELAFFLVQRGLAKYDNSREISENCEVIRPEFFLIDLTKKCNLACKYCFREFADDYPEMSAEMVDCICDSLIGYWRENPSLKISIQAWGGEPLLCLPLILQIRKRFNEVKLYPQIVMETNATLISKEVAEKLFENHIELGISIDGNSKVHDSQRPFVGGQASLAKVEDGIKNLRSVGYTGFGTITVVTRYTMDHLEDIIEYFVGMSIRSIKFNMMRKNKRNMELAPNIEQFGDYIERLLKCMYSLYKKKIPFVEQNIAQRMLNLMYRPNNNICNSYGCHGGYRMLSIDSKGKIFPCELSDCEDYCIGTIENNNYIGMVKEAIERNHEYFKKKDINDCVDCPWRYFCRGGCKAAVKYNTGALGDFDKTECAFNKALYPKLVKILLNEPDYAEYLVNGEVL